MTSVTGTDENNAHPMVIFSRRKLAHVRKQHVSKKYYNGTVWCVSVPNSYIVVRHNNRIACIGNSVNRANAEAGEYLFSKFVIKPSLERYKQALNYSIGKKFGSNLFLQYKDPVPPDPSVNLNTAVQGYAGDLLSKNEGRKRLGESPIVDGDKTISGQVADVLIPLDSRLGDENYIDHDNRGSSPYVIKSTSSERDLSVIWHERLSTELGDILKYVDFYYQDNTSTGEDVWTTLAKRYVNSFDKSITSTDLDNYSWEWEQRYGESVQSELESVFIRTFNSLLDDNLLKPSDVVIRALAKSYANQRMTDLLSKSGPTSILTTTRKRVRKILEDSNNIDELKDKLINDHAFSISRAKKIANTELSYIVSLATWKAGVLQGMKEKRWITANGEDASESCQANEKMGWIPILDKFSSSDQHPPCHPNCSCIIEVRVGDDGEGIRVHKISEEESSNPRCIECGHRYQIKNLQGQAVVWCEKCRKETKVIGT